MLFTTIIKTSLNNLRGQKTRSFLTMLGIIIGISSIIIITSVVAGAQSLITNQLGSIGVNLVGVLAGSSDEDGPPAAAIGIIITSLKDEDTEAIKRLAHVVAASSYVSAIDTIAWDNQKTTASVYGVSPDYPRLADSKLEQGLFFTEENKRELATVAVIGSQIKQDLFGVINPLGEKIKIKNNKFIVIGVMEPQGSSGFQNVDNMVFLPISTAQKKVLGIDHIGYLRARIDSEANMDQTVEEMKILLRQRHRLADEKHDDFTVRSMAEAMNSLNNVTSALQFFLIAIISISLIVGGIGIMNIMLASVKERIKEIGLRKSLGAKKKDILKQFLIETLIITGCGAIIGILIGIILSFIIAQIVRQLGYDWNFSITLFSIFLSCFFASAIGLIFGLYPAKKAARLNPIEAIRYE
jgi:putative ABC transport system permease protein